MKQLTNQLTKQLICVFALILGLSTLTLKPVYAVNPKCPQCKMTLATKKSSDTPTPIKLNGKTYYCCAGCKPASYGAAKTKKPAAKPISCARCKTPRYSSRKDAKHRYAVKIKGKTMYSCCPVPKTKKS